MDAYSPTQWSNELFSPLEIPPYRRCGLMFDVAEPTVGSRAAAPAIAGIRGTVSRAVRRSDLRPTSRWSPGKRQTRCCSLAPKLPAHELAAASRPPAPNDSSPAPSPRDSRHATWDDAAA